MEQYNLTTIVMKNLRNVCIPGPNRETIIEYYLTIDFQKLLGNHILAKDNSDVTIKKNQYKQNIIEIKSIYSDSPLEVRIDVEEDKSVSIIVSTEEGLGLFHIGIDNDSISNDITFDEDLSSVHEHQNVSFDKGDASEFELSRVEDGAIVYDGSLVPLLATHGEDEYFDFVSKLSEQKDEETSFLKRIYDSIANNSTVKVTTAKELHNLSDFVDSIFDALRTKLESTRAVKDVKIRKKTTDKK